MERMFLTNEEFDEWMAQMDSSLEQLVVLLPNDVVQVLDYSSTSLDALEPWILQHYDRYDAVFAAGERQLWDGLARYIGEVYRRELGGYWEVRLEDPKYAYFGMPQLTGFSTRPTPECPHFLVTTAVDRRKGNFLSNLLQMMKAHEAKWK